MHLFPLFLVCIYGHYLTIHRFCFIIDDSCIPLIIGTTASFSRDELDSVARNDVCILRLKNDFGTSCEVIDNRLVKYAYNVDLTETYAINDFL